jgi:hypothetical protein
MQNICTLATKDIHKIKKSASLNPAVVAPLNYRLQTYLFFLTLVYLHHLPTFQIIGVQFNIGESTANYIFHRWEKILRELLPASLLEQVKKMILIWHGCWKF